MLNFTQFSGSPYHIGLALGKVGAPAMHNVIKPSDQWMQLMQWLGSDELQSMQEQVQQQHPYIWDELQGLARGLELPPDEVFLWNSQGALPTHRDHDAPQDDARDATIPAAQADQTTVPDRPIGYTAVESTTLLAPTPQGPRIVHHMAGDPDVAEHCGVAEFMVDQGPEFSSFISPGLLAGHAVAVTNSGLCITANALQPHDFGKGIPPIILTRALLDMPDLSSAIQLLNDSARRGGLHLSLAQRGGSALLGVEVTAEKVSVQHASAPVMHTNHLIHDAMEDVGQTVSSSSLLRLDSGNQRLSQTNDPDPLGLLAEVSTGSRTVLTADLKIQSDAVEWDIYEEIGAPPRFRMRDGRHI